MMNRPPLPFTGNKSKCKKLLLKLFDTIKDGNEKTFVDLFGGSLFIAHLLKKKFPNARVITNDYDDYKSRLERIPQTNKVLNEIKEALEQKGYKTNDKIKHEDREIVKEILSKYENLDFNTICSKLLYSGALFYNNIDKLCNKELYLRYAKEIPDKNEEYLQGLEIVKDDWSIIFNEYKDKEDVIFICDPPFVNTYNIIYGHDWTFRDTLNTLEVLKHPCLYFTCSKTGVIQILDYLNMNIDSIEYNRGNDNNNKNVVNKETILLTV